MGRVRRCQGQCPRGPGEADPGENARPGLGERGLRPLPGRGGDVPDNILVDRLNYAHANRVYAANNLEWAKGDRFFRDKAEELSRGFRARQIPVHVLF